MEEMIQSCGQAGHEAQRTGGIGDVFGLQVEACGDGYAHRARDGERLAAERERHVDVHNVDTGESPAEQLLVGGRELHLLLGREPRDERQVMNPRGVSCRADAHQPDVMPLPLKLGGVLQRRVGRAVAPVAQRVHHQGDGERRDGRAGRGILRKNGHACHDSHALGQQSAPRDIACADISIATTQYSIFLHDMNISSKLLEILYFKSDKSISGAETNDTIDKRFIC